jgi:hypothetical protein
VRFWQHCAPIKTTASVKPSRPASGLVFLYVEPSGDLGVGAPALLGSFRLIAIIIASVLLRINGSESRRRVSELLQEPLEGYMDKRRQSYYESHRKTDSVAHAVPYRE